MLYRLRMAATAHGRPLPARRPGPRRAQRARIRRRRLGLALALLAAAAIGLTTTFAGGPAAPAQSRPLPDPARSPAAVARGPGGPCRVAPALGSGRARGPARSTDARHARLAAAHGADRPGH